MARPKKKRKMPPNERLTPEVMRHLMANPFSSMGLEIQEVSPELSASEYWFVPPEEEESDR